jgi:hypothetical protein
VVLEAFLVDELLEIGQVSGATEKDQHSAEVAQVLARLTKNPVKAW